MRIPFVLIAAAGLLTACGGGDKENLTTDSAPAVPQVVTIVAKDFSYEAPDTIAAGMVTLKLVNQGPDLHHVQLLRFSEGKTYADFTAGMATMQPGAPMPSWIREVAGPNTPVPGGETSITASLEAGNYAIICFIPGADQIPHAMKGMMRPLTVVPASGAVAAAPATDIAITMTDYAWSITPAITAGKHMIKLENMAAQPHEMVLVHLEAGKSVADLATWVENQQGPPPATPLGGISGMSNGDVVYVPVDLVPGEYGLLCFLPDVKDGKPHVAHGMMTQFKVQ